MDRESIQDTPRRSPPVRHTVNSPIQSVHPEMVMESLASQMDFGHRTADFFDNTTDDDSLDHAQQEDDEDVCSALDRPLHVRSKERRSGHYLGSTTEQFRSHCKEKRVSSPTALEAYLHANQPEAYDATLDDHYSSGQSSLVDSVEELTPSRSRRGHSSVRNRFRKHGILHNAETKEQSEDSPVLDNRPSKADKIMGIHAVHALTLQALQGIENGGQGLPLTPPFDPGERASRYMSADARAARYRSASAPAKKVSMAPPPIDTSSTRHFLPEHIVRTPYPLPETRRKVLGRSPNTLSETPFSPLPNDSLMTLSIKRNNENSRPRISTITIPANSDFGRALRSGSTSDKEKHFAGLEFDDMEFFRQLNIEFRALLGPYRVFAARSLSRIAVSGSASRAADAGYGWLHGPRSPRYLASQGLTDTFSEEKLLRHFRNPKQGKARYAWVNWAHRLAAAPSSSVSGLPSADTPLSTGTSSRAGLRSSMIVRSSQHEGLEFVLSWSVARITAVLVTVIVLSVAAALLWILLGTSSYAQTAAGNHQGGGGFRDAGDRAAAGAAIGISVLMLGLTGMGGWIGLSWLIL